MPNSLVVLCSHSGNTPETVDACAFANKNGALTAAYSNQVDSPLWNEAQTLVFTMTGVKVPLLTSIVSGMALRFTFGMLNNFKPL